MFRAAARQGVGAVLSTTATRSLEDVARHGSHPSPWFQLYFLGGLRGAEELIDRAAAAGYSTLVLTLDTPVPGLRMRDSRHGLSLPMQWSFGGLSRLAPQVVRRPGWLARVARHPSTLAMGNGIGGVSGAGLGELFDRVPTWEDIEWLRRRWNGSLVVKGITRADDAVRAAHEGVDAVVVSNHGGRQLDGQPSALECLEDVVAAVREQLPILMDGGIRTGADVARAIALGATAVLVGRPYLYGMAVAGERGADRVLALLRDELERTMQLLGATDLDALSRVPTWREGGA